MNHHNIKTQKKLWNKKYLWVIFLIVSLFPLTALTGSPEQVHHNASNFDRIPRASLSINGNAALDALCSPDGTDGLTWATAHVIDGENYIGSGTGIGLEIWNTNRYLILTNLYFYQYETGLYLWNTVNVKVLDNDFGKCDIGVHLEACSAITVSDNLLIGSVDSIYVEHCVDTVYESNSIRDFSSSGIYFAGGDVNEILLNNFSSGSTTATAIEIVDEDNEYTFYNIQDNTIDIMGYGIRLFGYGRQNSITYNTIQNAQTAIQVYDNEICEISYNVITDISGLGIAAYTASAVYIENNVIQTATTGIGVVDSEGAHVGWNNISTCTTGFYCIKSDWSSLQHNQITNCEDTGLKYSDSHQGVVALNSIDTADIGMEISYVTDTYILENTLINCTSSGMFMEMGKDNAILKNWFSANDHGLECQGGKFNTISENQFKDSHYGMYLVSEFDSSEIYKNQLDNLTTGIYLKESGFNYIYENSILRSLTGFAGGLDFENHYLENRIQDCDYGFYLTWCNYTEIANNIVVNTSMRAIYMGYSNFVEIRGNFLNATGTGIWLHDCNQGLLEYNRIANFTQGILLAFSPNVNFATLNLISDCNIGIKFWAASESFAYENWIWDTNDEITGEGTAINNYFWAPADHDSDGDGLTDAEELEIYNTDPNLIDTDGDGFSDGYEVIYGTYPGYAGSYPEIWETDFNYLLGLIDGNTQDLLNLIDQVDRNATLINICIAFMEGNWDYVQAMNATVENNVFQIIDFLYNINNGELADQDADGLADVYEITNGTDPTMIDTDMDNLLDGFEIKIGTDPLDDDSDGDLWLDGIEIAAGTNPLDGTNYPNQNADDTSEDGTSDDSSSEPDNDSLPQTILLGGGIGAIAFGTIVGIFLLKRKKS